MSIHGGCKLVLNDLAEAKKRLEKKKELPALDVSNFGMGLNAVRSLIELHNVAVAMCRGAHLATLKQYSHGFMNY